MQPKHGWHSMVPLCFRGNSATRFCMFPKVKSAGCSPGNAPVYINVYDLTNANGYVYWAGVGIFHTGVEGQISVFPHQFFEHYSHGYYFGIILLRWSLKVIVII